MALTGPLAPNGKQALLGAKIWEEETNAKGGLLGRKVKLINYDDQSNPAKVPGIYTKLLDVDKVDLVVGPYATNMIAPAMPVVMQKGKTFISLFALGCEQRIPLSEIFLDAAVRPDAEAIVHAKASSRSRRRRIRSRRPSRSPPRMPSSRATPAKARATTPRSSASRSSTTRPIRRARPTSRRSSARCRPPMPTCVIVCSYPLSSVGIVQSANELNFTPKMFGGAMVGLQATVFKDRLKSKLNGIINYETWVPSAKLMAPAAAFFKTYQARAKAEGVDPLGYYLGGWGYAYLQVLGEAVEGAKSINDDKLADYLHSHEFKTIMGDVKFGKNGEWTKSAMLQVQYHGITEAANLETWRGMGYQTVLTPADQKTGDVIYPYAKAK